MQNLKTSESHPFFYAKIMKKRKTHVRTCLYLGLLECLLKTPRLFIVDGFDLLLMDNFDNQHDSALKDLNSDAFFSAATWTLGHPPFSET